MSKKKDPKKGKPSQAESSPKVMPSTNDRKPDVCSNAKVSENSGKQQLFDRVLRVTQILVTVFKMGMDYLKE